MIPIVDFEPVSFTMWAAGVITMLVVIIIADKMLGDR